MFIPFLKICFYFPCMNVCLCVYMCIMCTRGSQNLHQPTHYKHTHTTHIHTTYTHQPHAHTIHALYYTHHTHPPTTTLHPYPHTIHIHLCTTHTHTTHTDTHYTPTPHIQTQTKTHTPTIHTTHTHKYKSMDTSSLKKKSLPHQTPILKEKVTRHEN